MNSEGKENIFVRGWQWGRAAWRAFSAHRATTVAGTLVFFLIMSLVPFVFWLTLLFGGNTAILDRVLELELFGWARDFLGFLQTNAQGATAGASIFLIATTLWSSSAFFYHLRRSGEIIYSEARPRRGWKVRLGAIGLTLLLMLTFAVAGAAFRVGAELKIFLGGIRNDFAQKLGKFSGVFRFLKSIALVSFRHFGVPFPFGDTAHSQIHAHFRAFAVKIVY